MRGNHECRQLTTFFNFKQECEIKYDLEVYEKLMDSFDCLPLACVINDKFPCVHGGLSPHIKTVNDIAIINRFMEPPKEGTICDILWADPCENDNEAILLEFTENSVRGCSYVFGSKAVTPFLNNNDYLSLLRAHEAQLEGFKMYNWDETCDFPSVITIFSAPNYCDVYNNKAAIIKINENMVNLQQFNYTAHPFILPNFQNVFNWSLPFISEKINEMLLHLIKKEEHLEEDDSKNMDRINSMIDQNISKSLKSKIKFVTMMIKLMKTLREENELIIKIKGLCPGNKIPRGLLLDGPLALKSTYEKYKNAKKLDSINEKYPVLEKDKKK